jgi:cyanophycinase-like exopeptidase
VLRRIPGAGWLALLGGGEFSFAETVAADAAWLAKTPPGLVGFLPAASDSADYGRHFAAYFEEAFGREVEVIPVYRARDARRAKNCERIAQSAAAYLGGGVTDHLLETLQGTPAADALTEKLRTGGVVAAIAAAAQAAGQAARSIFGGDPLPGLGWLPGGAVEPNFDPGHDRRLRQLLKLPTVSWGVGIPAGAALLLGPGTAAEAVGTIFLLRDAEADLEVFAGA